ncbi:SusC/RagA family TonB-linked outer membrane protein [Sphingobacterium sp. LRF_L2]|uniref:SusC/RagA family TonB-linked outer membrane protein n=1 Tax=Sphingobacterium sp. LRF_L2 TaxID=3369421 RepID=UPI003F5F6827
MKRTRILRYATYLLLYTISVCADQALAQVETKPIINASLTGKVIDAQTKEPIEGVTVQLQAVTHSVKTDRNGNFQFVTGQKLPFTLTLSYLGYTSKTIVVNTSPTLIELEQSTENLDEVVVVGYGVQKKRDITGAVTSLKEADFNRGAAVTSVEQLLQGTSAGVNIQQSSSEPGGGVNVRIRGNNSINAGSSPLYVVDGLPIDNSTNLTSSSGEGGIANNLVAKNPINAINPNDIASIEVLKDASATAIYGSRAANGVILITTKRGAKGQRRLNYSLNGGVQSIAKKIDILNTSEYIDVINQLAAEKGQSPVFDADAIAEIGAGTDWQSAILRKASIQDHNISLSGGDEGLTYFTSLNITSQDGIVRNTGMDRYAGRVNLESRFATKGKFGVNISTSRILDNNAIDGNSINESAGPINSALLYDPTEKIYNDDGSFTQSSFLTINNPLSLIEGISNESATNRTLGNLFLEYELIKGLKAKINVGADLLSQRRDIFNSRLTIRGAAQNGIANIASLEKRDILGEYTMNYNTLLGDKNTLDVLGGVTYQNFQTKRFVGSIGNFPSDDLETNNLSLGDIATASLSSGKADNTLLSYLGRVNYTHNEKYLLTASFRADGSSRFGADNKYGFFPSLAAGWLLSNESFIPELFNNLKLRASWGVTGNQDIGNYNSLQTYTTGGTFVSGSSLYVGTSPSRIGNRNLKWESTAQADIGVDASIFKNRLNLTIDYFVKNTKDMLIELPLPSGTGYSSILSNIGSMENRGIELFVSADVIQNEKFRWTSSINFTRIRNKVTDLGDIKSIITGNASNIGNVAIITEGQPAFAYYGYKVTGIFKDAEEVANSAQKSAKPGYPIFEDVNKDGVINTSDQQIIGNPFPDFTYGWRNEFNYKDFGLSFLLQGQKGGDVLNGNILESMYPSNYRRNMLRATVEDRWTTENTDAKWPSALEPTSYGGGKVNTLALQDASYLRLKYVQLNYNVPLRSTKAVRQLQLYLSAQNLFTLSKYIGYDPEANALGTSSARVDLNTYPLARVWAAGINVSF